MILRGQPCIHTPGQKTGRPWCYQTSPAAKSHRRDYTISNLCPMRLRGRLGRIKAGRHSRGAGGCGFGGASAVESGGAQKKLALRPHYKNNELSDLSASKSYSRSS
jgi:hypothetical protein